VGTRVRREPFVVLAAIVAVGFNLRIGLVSIGPLLEEIRTSLRMSHPEAGLIATIPALALAALFAPGGRWTAIHGPRRTLVLALVTVGTAIILRSATTPGLWIAFYAFGVGALFPLALTLDVAPNPATAGRLASTALGIGYAASACAPVLVGGLHDLSGGYGVPLVVTAGFAAATIPFAFRLPRRRPAVSSP
jgi:CP family cyanate transporter-like MFS transporter